MIKSLSNRRKIAKRIAKAKESQVECEPMDFRMAMKNVGIKPQKKPYPFEREFSSQDAMPTLGMCGAPDQWNHNHEDTHFVTSSGKCKPLRKEFTARP